MIFDAAGPLYETTAAGGRTGCTYGDLVLGCGTVFKLTPPATPGGTWTETVLYDFTGGSYIGVNPNGVIFDPTGALYGTTGNGGDLRGRPKMN